MSVVVAAIARIIKERPSPGSGRPWTIQIAEIAAMIDLIDFPDRQIGRLVRKMPFVWTRLSVEGRRLVLIPQEVAMEDLIPSVDGRGSVCAFQLSESLLEEAEDLLAKKREKEIGVTEPVDPEKFTGVQAQLWKQMTPEQQAEYRENIKNPMAYFGPRGGQ
jgi:hypothetical protein